MRTLNTPALVVGFAAEARVARLSGWPVAIGGGTTAGAARAVRRLIDAGATGIVSFGLAGGLDPLLPAGALVVAHAVTVNGSVLPTDPALNARLGGSTGHLCLGLDRVVVSSDEKLRLSQMSGASVVDMESGAIAMIAAAAGVPFAVLRAVCDPAHRTLPPAALVALDAAGRLLGIRLALSVLTRPGQLRVLLALARDAALARRALRARAIRMAPDRPIPGDARALPGGMLPGGILTGEPAPERVPPDGILPHGITAEGILRDDLLPDELLPEVIL